MKGFKFEKLEETWEPENLEKYLGAELQYIKKSKSDDTIKDRILTIFRFGEKLGKNYQKEKQLNGGKKWKWQKKKK